MRTPSIKTLTFFVSSLLFLTLASCEEDPNENGDLTEENEGIRLKYYESPSAIGNAIKSFLKPGFTLSEYSELKDIGNYETSGYGLFEYGCSWKKITPLDPNPGEHRESVHVAGVPHGWDINDEHERTTKAELLANNDGYEEVFDPRLDEAPYKTYLIVLKKKDNEKGSWKFLAYIAGTHQIDGDGQRAGFSGGFSPLRSAKDHAEYEVPTDEMAVSIFLKLVEPMK